MKPSIFDKPEQSHRGETQQREPKLPTLRRAKPPVVSEDRIREIEGFFRIRQQVEAQMVDGMLGQLSAGPDQMDEVVYDMLRALKDKYDKTPDVSSEERQKDLSALLEVRNGLTAVFRKIDLVRDRVAKGIKERRKMELVKMELEERRKREAEEASLWGRIKSVFAPREPTPIAISGKRGRQIELVKVDDESEQCLKRLKERRDELSMVMEEVDEAMKFLRQMEKAA